MGMSAAIAQHLLRANMLLLLAQNWNTFSLQIAKIFCLTADFLGIGGNAAHFAN